jgi:hypothetical protein
MKVVAKVAAPGLRGVLGLAGQRHLAVPQGVTHLDGRSGSTALGILAVGRGVRHVVQEPTRVGDSAHLGRRALRS